jgi:3-isopropylmalate/(R)-2-methylmalate dehydratase large subunit
MAGKTLFDKIWDRHVIAELGGGYALMHVSRHLMHDGGAAALERNRLKGYKVRNPELTFATMDHAVSTEPGRTAATRSQFVGRLDSMRHECQLAGVPLFDLNQPGQGIIHVIGPELGLSLPGTFLVCGDSHTCTHGGMGCIAFGIGSSEVSHVLATQSLVQRRPQTMRATFDGTLAPGVRAKDLILYLIGQIGTAGGTGYALEYAGSAIRSLPVEGRLTLCNLSIEAGAKIGFVAPDETTFAFLKGRSHAPKGELWEKAVADWHTLPSDADASFDREVKVDVAKIAPQITWGTSPEHVVAVTERIPDPNDVADPDKKRCRRSEYMGLKAGHRSPARRSIGYSSAPAPTVASATSGGCAASRRWRRGHRLGGAGVRPSSA